MAALTYEQLIEELKKQIYKPIYFLMGEEPYFIDAISDYIEENVLNEAEKSFNLTVAYGKDTDLASIVSLAKRYPMMSNYQVVIIKEAQNIKNLDASEVGKKINPLLSYLQQPLSSTILVVCYKGKKLEKNRKIYKAIEKCGVIFESKKIYETKLPAWIINQFKLRGKTIEPKAANLMADFIGNNLSSIINEINKLLIFLENEKEINVAHIEKLIGISKDFNNTELLKAIGTKNITQANRILLYFQSDPRQHPVQQTIVWLFEYFSKVILYKDFQNLSDNEISSKIGVPPYFLDDYKNAAKLYPRNQLIQNIHIIREYDMKSKGVDSVADGHELLKEMVYKIMYGI
ncbi:MAG TPA: DNA polymerase III subunit delta [Bacteroidales bacterium]|nr:DNA polymerase III subunit delta [Bacteroidales bacterium]